MIYNRLIYDRGKSINIGKLTKILWRKWNIFASMEAVTFPMNSRLFTKVGHHSATQIININI